MEGLEYFNLLTNNDSTVKDALLVGKNLFNQHPSAENIFTSYFAFLCKLASYPISPSERKFFANEADITLAYFAENIKMNETSLNLIKASKSKLEIIINDILSMDNALAQNELSEILANNANQLAELVNLKGKLFSATQKSDFDLLLLSVQSCENSIEKKYLNQEEHELYDTLTKDYTSLVNSKLLEFERLANIEYNKAAAKSYKLVFDSFQSAESKYKDNQSQLYSLVAKDLFGYDATRLFNETLIYYNHVYSFVFNKLDENGKYRLTQFSIDCEKIRM